MVNVVGNSSKRPECKNQKYGERAQLHSENLTRRVLTREAECQSRRCRLCPLPLTSVILSEAPRWCVIVDNDGRVVEGSRRIVPLHDASGSSTRGPSL